MIRESKKLKLHKESPVYTVESIDGWEIRGKLLWFLVRWQGYSVPLWQLASELGNDELVNDYMKVAGDDNEHVYIPITLEEQ